MKPVFYWPTFDGLIKKWQIRRPFLLSIPFVSDNFKKILQYKPKVIVQRSSDLHARI